MAISLFNTPEGKQRKPGFFQRIRQAVSGSEVSKETPEQATSTHVDVSPASTISQAADTATLRVPTEAAGTASASKLPEGSGTVGPVQKPDAGTPLPLEQANDLAITPEQPTRASFVPPSLVQPNEYGLRPVSSGFSFGGYASAEEEDESFLGKMRDAVSRTRDQLGASLDTVLAMGRSIDEHTLDELEAALLTADIGAATTQDLMRTLRVRALREKATTTELKIMLKDELRVILDSVEQPTNHPAHAPEVIMMVGVNGTGKTTTSGKLAALYGTHGRKALLCAADTFRAAAIEQLEVWARRSNVDIIKTKQGGDPSAALYDSLTAGKARGADIVIVDTAGRLHNKAGLMAELDKMRRTAQKLVPGAPHQVFLVMDATTGQNGMQQARLFTESAGVTGIVLTKLDGTAKGGIVVAIARELRLPVVFAGVGEKMEDIIPFNSDAFLDSLLSS